MLAGKISDQSLTTRASVISPPLILALVKIAFVLNMIEIFLDILFPNREVQRDIFLSRTVT